MSRGRLKKPVFPDRIVDPGSLPHAVPRWRGNLPHILKDGCTYFVTFCLHDVVFGRRVERSESAFDGESIRLVREHDPSPDLGGCLLKDPALASIVEDSLLHFQNVRYLLSAWCVMPNHVHVVVTPHHDHSLSTIVHSWKSYSAHEINRLLGRKGTVWQEEAFDHIVRDEKSMERFVRYIEDNPVIAGLCDRPEQWPVSSARFRDHSE